MGVSPSRGPGSRAVYPGVVAGVIQQKESLAPDWFTQPPTHVATTDRTENGGPYNVHTLDLSINEFCVYLSSLQLTILLFDIVVGAIPPPMRSVMMCST